MMGCVRLMIEHLLISEETVKGELASSILMIVLSGFGKRFLKHIFIFGYLINANLKLKFCHLK